MIKIWLTLSSADNDIPSSSSDNSRAAIVPSVLHASKMVWSLIWLQDKSNTLSSNKSWTTAKGRWYVVHQIEIERSREPTARQQYCFFFDESLFRKIDWLKRWQFFYQKLNWLLRCWWRQIITDITSQRQAIDKRAYHTIYCFPMTDKIFITLPTFTLDYLSSWTTWKNATQFYFISFPMLHSSFCS